MISKEEMEQLLQILRTRFEKNRNRHSERNGGLL